MGFPYFKSCNIYMFMIIALTAVYSQRMFIVHKKPCCDDGVRPRLVTFRSFRTIQQPFLGVPANKLQPKTEPAAEEKMPTPKLSKEWDMKDEESDEALMCSKLVCPPSLLEGPVCACNFNTGHVVTFKSKCDMKKHNCRFHTGFKVVLTDICPWEFESRRAGPEDRSDYDDPKYYNNY